MKRLNYILGAIILPLISMNGCGKEEKVIEPDRPQVITTVLNRVMEDGIRSETDSGVQYVLDVHLPNFFQSGDGLARIIVEDPHPVAASSLEIAEGDLLKITIENEQAHVVAFIEDYDVNGYQGEDLASKYYKIDRLNQRVLYTDYVARDDLGKGISVFYEVVGVALNALEGKSFSPPVIKEPLLPTEPPGPAPQPLPESETPSSSEPVPPAEELPEEAPKEAPTAEPET